MSNYKIRVNNEAESKEVQELFFELGFGWGFGDIKYLKNLDMPYLYACAKSKNITHSSTESYFIKHENKELTIPQLRDMVVLKRNNVNDATHEDQYGDAWLCVAGIWYFYSTDKKWDDCLKSQMDRYQLNQIEKKEMKEFLDKDYVLRHVKQTGGDNRVPIDWIEIPKGCDYLVSSFGVNSFLDKDLFNKVGFENLLWSRNELKEFLVNHDNKWTLQLLDADTEENSFRVAVPSGYGIAVKKDNGDIRFTNDIGTYFGEHHIWVRSEDFTKVTIDELKHRVSDKVNNPSHYSDSIIECIDAMEAMLSPQEFIGYLRGNMFKYQWRYQKKNGIEDLQKSEWYLKKLIEKEMKNEDE